MIFHIYGTDAYLCQEKLKSLQAGFVEKKDKGGFNVIRLTADDISLDRFTQEALTVPFLSEKKLIVIENLCVDTSAGMKKLREDIAEFLKGHETLDNNLLFIDVFEDEKKLPEKDVLFSYLKNQKYAWYLPALTNRQLGGWIKKYCAANQISISAAGIEELILLVGNDLVQLTTELDKLKAFKNNEPIEPVDVRLLVKAKFDSNVFRLTDALANKDRKLALELMAQELLAGAEPLALLGSINWQFKSLIKIKSALADNPRLAASTIATQAGLHPYVVTKNLATLKKFTLTELTDILNQLCWKLK